MRKLIISLILVAVLIAPISVQAQTRAEINQQINIVLLQLIEILQKQVIALQLQLFELQHSQTTPPIISGSIPEPISVLKIHCRVKHYFSGSYTTSHGQGFWFDTWEDTNTDKFRTLDCKEK